MLFDKGETQKFIFSHLDIDFWNRLLLEFQTAMFRSQKQGGMLSNLLF